MNPQNDILERALANIAILEGGLDGSALDEILLNHTGHDWEWWTAAGEDFVDEETGFIREDIMTMVEVASTVAKI